MNLTKRNIINLDLNPGHLIRLVLDWVGCWVAYFSFRCHAFYWWVIWWLWRVTCCPISKYWWSGYWRRCVYQMYRWCQYLFYHMNIGWIMDWSDVCWLGFNGFIQVGAILINVNRVGIFVIPSYRIFAPNVFNLKIISAVSIFEKKLPLRFSLSLLADPCHGEPL